MTPAPNSKFEADNSVPSLVHLGRALSDATSAIAGAILLLPLFLSACSSEGPTSLAASSNPKGACLSGGGYAFVAPREAVEISNNPDFAVVNLQRDGPGAVEVINLKTGEATRVVPPRSDLMFNGVAVNSQGTHIATILTPPPYSGLGEIWVSSLVDGTSEVVNWSPGRMPKSLEFSNDGRSIVYFRDVDPIALPVEWVPVECRVPQTFAAFEADWQTGQEKRIVQQAWDNPVSVSPIGLSSDRFLVLAVRPLMRNPNPYDVSRGEFWVHSSNRAQYEDSPWWRGIEIERGIEPAYDNVTRFLTNDVITDQPPHDMDRISLRGSIQSLTADNYALVNLHWTHGYKIGRHDDRDGFYLVRGNTVKKLPALQFEGTASISPNGLRIVKRDRLADNSATGSYEVLRVYDKEADFQEKGRFKLKPATKSLVLTSNDASALK